MPEIDTAPRGGLMHHWMDRAEAAEAEVEKLRTEKAKALELYRAAEDAGDELRSQLAASDEQLRLAAEAREQLRKEAEERIAAVTAERDSAAVRLWGLAGNDGKAPGLDACVGTIENRVASLRDYVDSGVSDNELVIQLQADVVRLERDLMRALEERDTARAELRRRTT